MPSPRLGAFFSMLREYSVTTEPRKLFEDCIRFFLMVILRRFDFLISTVFQLKC